MVLFLQKSTKLTAVHSVKYRGGSGPILLDETMCRGTETSLAQCFHKRFYSHDCDHSEDVGIICNIKVWETGKWSKLLLVFSFLTKQFMK